MWIKHPWDTFVQITWNKIIYDRVIGDKWIWGRMSFINSIRVSKSVFYQVLNAVSDGVFKIKSLMEKKIIFHLKRIP